MRIYIPLKEGTRFGKLVVTGKYKKKSRYYFEQVKCDCGVTKFVGKIALTCEPKTESCGCLSIGTHRSHGMTHTRFFKIWCGMKSRCQEKHKDSKYYYKRGIRVCKRWLRFENFKEDLYEDYQKHVKDFGTSQTTLDRKNNYIGYNPKNCRWATWSEQRMNLRKKL